MSANIDLEEGHAMRHSVQEREISTVCSPCLIAPEPGHYARTHNSTHVWTQSYHEEDGGSLSEC